MALLWLPAELTVSGNQRTDLILLYSQFENDFKTTKPVFRSTPVLIDRLVKPGDPYEDIFHHLISKEDKKTRRRTFDAARARRLPWCAALINNAYKPGVKVWDFEGRKKKIRSCIWLVNYDYVVILEHRHQTNPQGQRFWRIILRTAYVVGGRASKLSLLGKYKARL